MKSLALLLALAASLLVASPQTALGQCFPVAQNPCVTNYCAPTFSTTINSAVHGSCRVQPSVSCATPCCTSSYCCNRDVLSTCEDQCVNLYPTAPLRRAICIGRCPSEIPMACPPQNVCASAGIRTLCEDQCSGLSETPILMGICVALCEMGPLPDDEMRQRRRIFSRCK